MSAQAFREAASGKKEPRAKTHRNLCVRLTVDERRRLEALAGGLPLSAFVRKELLGRKAKRRQSDAPAPKGAEYARLLSALGRSRLVTHLQALNDAALSQGLQMAPKLEQELSQACRDIADLREALITQLGLKPK